MSAAGAGLGSAATAAASAALRPYQARAFGLTWLVYASYYLCRKNYSVAKASLEKALGTDATGLATLETGYNVMYMVGQFASGIAGDRLGAKRVLVAGMFLSAFCNAVVGTGASFALVFMALCMNGIAQSTGWPNTVRSMADWYGPAERGRVMGLWSTNYQIGGIAASALASWLIAWGWRFAYFGPALALGLVALVFGVLHVAKPADVGLPPLALEVGAAAAARGAAPAVVAGNRAEVRRRLLRSPVVWVFGASYFCLKLIRYSILFWLPYFLTKRLGYASGKAGFLSVSFEVGGFAGAVLAGWISDRVLKGRRVPVAVVMSAGLAGALWLYTQVAGLGAAANFAGMCLVGLFLFGPDSLLVGAAAQDLGGRENAGTAAGIINGIGSAGQVVQGYLTAYISVRFGWDWLFTIFMWLALAASLVLLPFWRLGAAKPVAPGAAGGPAAGGSGG